MFDLLVVGGLGVDIRVRVPAIPVPAADSVTVPPIDLRIGNTGAGVALAADALGLRVALVDVVGDDPAGQVVRTALDRTGVHAVLRADPRGTRRSVNMVDPTGRRMSLYDPRGGWTGPPPFTAAEVAELTGGTAHVHLSIVDWVRDLAPVLRAALPAGVAVSTDLHDWDGANDHHRPFLAAADLVFVSGVALGTPPAELSAATADGRGAAGAPQRTVLVTHGARGAVLVEPGSAPLPVPAAAAPGPVVDTNGAGDAFAAGYLAARRRDVAGPDAARYAATVAAAACAWDGMEYPPELLPRL